MIQIRIFDPENTLEQIQHQLNEAIAENGGQEQLLDIFATSQSNRDLNHSSRLVYTLVFKEAVQA